MKEFFRRFKFSFALYNFFHKKELLHNETIYKKLGLNKKYYSPVSSKDFAGLPGSVHDEIRVDKMQLEQNELFKQLSEENKKSLYDYEDNGYAILKKYIAPEKVDAINAAIDEGLASGKYEFVNKNKIMFAFHTLPQLKAIAEDEQLNGLLGILLNGKPMLFQSINFIMGSEQHTHSDSIHMTTYPLGGLLGVWIALEDIDKDNGPLHYYPGSHKLPYYLNRDYDNEGSTFMVGDKEYTEYEEMIEKKIKEKNLEKKTFHAHKGDVLIWHANLFHGGNAHHNKTKTRKSVVFHYFKAGSICYHEITQRPALIKPV